MFPSQVPSHTSVIYSRKLGKRSNVESIIIVVIIIIIIIIILLFFSSGDINRALEDLNKAIDLSKDHGADAAAQAYTQRGLIHRLNREDKQAYEDFSKAAALGSTFAKSMVVQLNPYAAMCNKMLAEAISKLKGDSL